MSSNKRHLVGKNLLIKTDTNLSRLENLAGISNERAARFTILDIDHPDIENFVSGSKFSDKVVRVSDLFMKAVEANAYFDLLERTTGKLAKTVHAGRLFRLLVNCGVGIQFDGAINAWHTLPKKGKIIASNSSSEFFSVDGSTCQTATIDLLRFLKKNQKFNFEKFITEVEVLTTNLDKNAKKFRQLGIGYKNLDLLLAGIGLAHESKEARAVAGGITSLLSAAAYRQSAELSEIDGQYDGFELNASAQTFVVKKHADASMKLTDEVVDVMKLDFNLNEVLFAANREWANALTLGAKNGWRNSQVTLLINDDVFDLDPISYVQMLAAVQSFLSGGISGKVVAPENTTAEEVEEIYMLGWKLGLKSLKVEL